MAEKCWKYQAEIYYIIYTIPFSFSIFSQSSMDFSAIFNLFWIFCNKLFWQSLHRLLKLKTSGKDKTFNFKNWLKSAEKGWKYQAEIYYIIYSIPFSFSIFSQSSKDFSAIFNLFFAISEKSWKLLKRLGKGRKRARYGYKECKLNPLRNFVYVVNYSVYMNT